MPPPEVDVSSPSPLGFYNLSTNPEKFPPIASIMSAIAIIVLFAVLQNIDNFVLAAAYRLKNVLIPFRMNVLIAVFSGIATGVPVIVASGIRLETVQIGVNLTTHLPGPGTL